ncbi:YggL family protein [Curvibacter fontanus]
MPPSVHPNVNKRRSRRLRKKLRIAEFQQLGFDYSIVWSQLPTVSQQDRFINGFLEEIIVARDLLLGGGCTEGAIVGAVQNPTELDRDAVLSWLRAIPGVVKVHVGPLVDAWHGDY